jgi:hypothetical protein
MLRTAAPLLDQLQLVRSRPEHLLALSAMPRLRRLDVDGDPPGIPAELQLPPLPGEHAGLLWLRVSDLPRTTLVSLLRAHRHSLRKLSLHVGTPGSSKWPENCGDLHTLLGQCELRELRWLVLQR